MSRCRAYLYPVQASSPWRTETRSISFVGFRCRAATKDGDCDAPVPFLGNLVHYGKAFEMRYTVPLDNNDVMTKLKVDSKETLEKIYNQVTLISNYFELGSWTRTPFL